MAGSLKHWRPCLFSTRRPPHLAPAQNVDVQMPHALPAFFALIGHQAKPIGAVLRAKCRRDFQAVAERLRIGVVGIFERVARDDEDVDGRDGRDVGKSDANGVLINERNADFAARDLAKNGFHKVISPAQRARGVRAGLGVGLKVGRGAACGTERARGVWGAVRARLGRWSGLGWRRFLACEAPTRTGGAMSSS